MLAERVLEGAVDIVGDDLALERDVLGEERRIGPQGVAERKVPTQLAVPGLDVAVDPQRQPVDRHGAHQHGSGRRERVRARLGLEAKGEQGLHDRRDGSRVRRDRQVHDPLAGQAGNRRAPDVLDDEIRPAVTDQGGDAGRSDGRSWVEREQLGRLPDVGPDRG